MHSPETGTPQLRIAAILLCRSRAIVYSVRLFGLRCKLGILLGLRGGQFGRGNGMGFDLASVQRHSRPSSSFRRAVGLADDVKRKSFYLIFRDGCLLFFAMPLARSPLANA